MSNGYRRVLPCAGFYRNLGSPYFPLILGLQAVLSEFHLITLELVFLVIFFTKMSICRVMIHKIKYRVAYANRTTKKFAFNLDEGNVVKITKAFILQEPSSEQNSTVLCTFEVTDGKVKIAKIFSGPILKVNSRPGDEFILAPGDLLQVDEFHIEFLEIPHEEPVNDNKTRFVTIGGMSANPAPVSRPAPQVQTQTRPPAKMKGPELDEDLSQFDTSEDMKILQDEIEFATGEKTNLQIDPMERRSAPRRRPESYETKQHEMKYKFQPVHYVVGGAAIVFALMGVVSMFKDMFRSKPVSQVAMVETVPMPPPVAMAPVAAPTAVPAPASAEVPPTVVVTNPEPKPEIAAPVVQQAPVSNNHNFAVDAMAAEIFFSAVRSGRLSVVKSMIDKKLISPDFTLDKDGSTALMHAAAGGRIEVVKYLLQQRVSINAQDPNGTTALMWAVFKGHADVVEMLLKKGGRLDLKRDDGDTAMDLAKKWKRHEIAKILDEVSGERSARKIASHHKDKKKNSKNSRK